MDDEHIVMYTRDDKASIENIAETRHETTSSVRPFTKNCFNFGTQCDVNARQIHQIRHNDALTVVTLRLIVQGFVVRCSQPVRSDNAH